MCLTLLSQPAQAISLSFSFDESNHEQQTITKTVGGVTINLFGINSSGGVFNADPDGIVLDSYGGSNQFNISFDQAVQFASYGIGYTQDVTTGSFNLSNPNGTASTGNDLANVGTFNFNNPFSLNAGQTSTLTATVNGLSQLKTITVDYNATPVPWETDATPVIGSTVLFGTGIWAKRKFAARTKLV
jgi:hypothetical protein